MWLAKRLRATGLPEDPYLEYVLRILQNGMDVPEKSEALLDALEGVLAPNAAEAFVRDILVTFEKRGPESLEEGSGDDEGEDGVVVVKSSRGSRPISPRRIPTSGSVTSSTSSSPTLNVHAPEFNIGAPEFVPSFNSSSGWGGAEDKHGFLLDGIVTSLKHLDTSEVFQDNGDDYLDYEEAEGFNTLSPEEILQSVFTDLSLDQITSMLELNNYNLEATLESILQPPDPISSEPQSQQNSQGVSPAPQSATPGRQYPLRFLNHPNVQHDPEARLCKFWLQGRCMKGDRCVAAGQGSVGNARAQQSYGRGTVANGIGAGDQNLGPSQEDFPALSPASKSLRPTIDFWGPTAKFVDVAKRPPPKSKTPSGTQKSAKGDIAAPLTPPRRSTRLVDARWVATGDTLAATYAKYRQEAIEAAIQRNKLFQRATEAFLAGNKAAAKAFSLGAHRLNERVEELHRAAGRRIFEERNKSSVYHSLGSSASGEPVIDLHGLHPTEAVEMAEMSLDRLRREKYTGTVLLVTGTGHHSRTQKAKVLPAVRDWLHRSGIRASEGTMRDGRGGVFTVQLQ
ncbi:hypothetical protein HK104_001343 [Borealophlyctis nickersoniae]|nr:hypothetical protein HK104_001343 [Borealophlyctis nickersoniae]